MNRCFSLTMAFSLVAASVFAAPKRAPIAEGFLDWDGLDAKNYLSGHLITPSDLRHRAVVYVVVDAAHFTNQNLADYKQLPSLTQMPSDHLCQWETQELPRQKIMVVSVRNADKKLNSEAFKQVFKIPKGTDPKDTLVYSAWRLSRVSFYKNMSLFGEEEIPLNKLPYVAVYGGSSVEPLYAKENWSEGEIRNVKKAVNKAVSELGEWSVPLGVSDPQFFKDAKVDIEKGKPLQKLMAKLQAGIKSKNPEQAKEAQIMFDALNQYKSDLMIRIECEFKAAPARAYYDFQNLIKYFPSEKKKLQKIDAMMKQNKEIGAIGKVFEKLMLWNREDFVCKSPGEAKKIVLELKKIKKALESLANSQSASVQGEAMLFQSQIDDLIDIIPTKVQQK